MQIEVTNTSRQYTILIDDAELDVLRYALLDLDDESGLAVELYNQIELAQRP